MKTLIMCLIIILSTVSVNASTSAVTVTEENFGIRDIIISGEAANTLYNTLTKSAGGGLFKDGHGINCYQQKEIYCIIPVKSDGIIDLYEIP